MAEPGARILNVDHDPARRAAVSAELRQAGYDVEEAGTGEAALARLEPGGWDLVLLELDLPDLNGFEVCRRIRARPERAGSAIIYFAAAGRPAAEQAADLEACADAYLVRPVQARELVATVEATLRVRRAERGVRQAALEWQTTFDAIEDGILLLGSAGEIRRVNRAALELVGAEPSELHGRGYEAVLAEAFDLDGSPSLSVLRRGAPRQIAEASAKARHFRIALDPIGPAARDGAVLVVTEVSERKALESALRDRARSLESADQRKNEFMAMLAHELRNPLGAISAAVDILSDGAGDGRPHRAMAVVKRQMRTLSRLMDDLLDVSRITHGKVELRRQNADLRAHVAHVVEAAQSGARAAGQELRLHSSPDPVVASVDVIRIEQVLANVLDNAVRYGYRGGVVDVSLRAVQDGEERWAEIAVSDTGEGIDAARIGEIFGPFVQFDRTLARSHGGLGLGLTLCKELVEMHGGTISARSEGAGKGSTFTIRLPLAEAAAAEPEKTPEPRPANKRRILIVEDNDDLRQLLAWKLRHEGHEVYEAADGLLGLKLARAQLPDVAVLDVGLPEMSGYDLASALRADPDTASIHLIALTGYGADEDRRIASESGFDHHLVKPVGLDDLIAVLEHTGECASQPGG